LLFLSLLSLLRLRRILSRMLWSGILLYNTIAAGPPSAVTHSRGRTTDWLTAETGSRRRGQLQQLNGWPRRHPQGPSCWCWSVEADVWRHPTVRDVLW